MTYQKKLFNAISKSASVLCAGIDPVPEAMPAEIRKPGASIHETVLSYCRCIMEQTCSRVAAYKINLAYFEALGPDAYRLVEEVLHAVPSGKIMIADAKRGDVPHSNERYKAAFFDRFGFDAITLSPFMGLDTLAPFLDDESRAVYALTLTSNPGAADLMTQPFGKAPTLSAHLASLLRTFSREHPGSLGMVIGATQSEVYGPVMQAFPEAPLLVPGIGAQAGSIQDLESNLSGHPGLPLINVSRGLSVYDPENRKPWEAQISDNADRFHALLRPITDSVIFKNTAGNGSDPQEKYGGSDPGSPSEKPD